RRHRPPSETQGARGQVPPTRHLCPGPPRAGGRGRGRGRAARIGTRGGVSVSAIFSWPTFRAPWRLDVDAPMVDGYYREDLVDEEHRRSRLDGLGRWRQVILDVAASPPDDALVP